MSREETAELIEIKNATLKIEKSIEVILRELTKKHKIDFDRADDHGQRGFTLDIYFDDFNIEALDGLMEIKPLYVEFVKCRKRQKQLEEKYNTERRIHKDMQTELRKLTGNVG
jgi:hypothetical protein